MAPQKTKGVFASDKRSEIRVDCRYRNRRDWTRVSIYARVKNAKGAGVTSGDPGDDSPRFFLHGLLAYTAPVGLLDESRAFLALAGRYMCVLRASHRPLFAIGNRNSFSADRTSARGYLAPHRLTDMPCREMLCEILFTVSSGPLRLELSLLDP